MEASNANQEVMQGRQKSKWKDPVKYTWVYSKDTEVIVVGAESRNGRVDVVDRRFT